MMVANNNSNKKVALPGMENKCSRLVERLQFIREPATTTETRDQPASVDSLLADYKKVLLYEMWANNKYTLLSTFHVLTIIKAIFFSFMSRRPPPHRTLGLFMNNEKQAPH